MSEEIVPVVPIFAIVSNPYDLEIRIMYSRNCFVISRGPDGNRKVLFRKVFDSESDYDCPAQVGNYLRVMVHKIEEEKSEDPQLKLFNSSMKKVEEIDMLTDTHVDIIVDGLRMHNGIFKTYK